MKNTLRINGISTAKFLFLVIVAMILLLLSCILGSKLDRNLVEVKDVAIVAMVIFVGIGSLVLGVSLYWYLFTLEVSPTQVSYSAPFRKAVVFTRDEITAFGLMSYYGQRDIRFYVCAADKETVWAFYRQNTDKCELLLEKKDYHKLLESEDKNWVMAMGVYILCRQPGVYLLPAGSVKSMKAMEQIINMKATPTGSGCSHMWNATVTEF